VRRLLFTALLIVSPAILHAETRVALYYERQVIQAKETVVVKSGDVLQYLSFDVLGTLIVQPGAKLEYCQFIVVGELVWDGVATNCGFDVYGTLTMKPGAQFESCRFEIHGNLIAKGTEADSITITRGTGIRFFGGESYLSYMRISGCVVSQGSHPNWNMAYASGGGIHVSGDGTLVHMSHCVVERNTANGSDTVSGSFFAFGRGGGVSVINSARLEMKNCIISENQTFAFGCAAIADVSAFLLLEQCLLRGNDYRDNLIWGAGGVVASHRGAELVMRNCTVVGNQSAGILLHSVRGDISVVNSILWQSGHNGEDDREYDPGTVTVNHSITQHPFPGEGNIIADPLFLDSAGGDFHIAYNSPARNAGDPAYGLDIDGTLPDLGAFPRIRLYPMTVSDSDDGPLAFALHPNTPNPFNPSTRLQFDLPASSPVRMDIYNAAGQQVLRLVNEYRSAGQHTAVWDGCDVYGRPVASGVYVYRLTSEHDIATRRMLLVR
jgi:hypothetical protein